MSKTFDSKETHAAKDYVCQLSGTIIKKGELHLNFKYVNPDKKLSTIRISSAARRLINELTMQNLASDKSFDESIELYNEYVNNYIREKKLRYLIDEFDTPTNLVISFLDSLAEVEAREAETKTYIGTVAAVEIPEPTDEIRYIERSKTPGCWFFFSAGFAALALLLIGFTIFIPTFWPDLIEGFKNLIG